MAAVRIVEFCYIRQPPKAEQVRLHCYTSTRKNLECCCKQLGSTSLMKKTAFSITNGSSLIKKQASASSFLSHSIIICSAANKPTPSSDISSTAKIRSEVLSPFRSFRMFFYIAFIASGGLGGLIATTRLVAALSNPGRAAEVPDTVKGLAIDIGAVAVFAFLYLRDNKAKNAQVARLSREETLSQLKLRINENKILPLSSMRGIARLVICAGPASFITEAFKLSEPFTEKLVERGVLVVPFATDGNQLSLELKENEETKDIIAKRKRLWQLSPVYVKEWEKWLDEQKKMAGVSPESPVYLSLRMDGRVRGSGVGYPPWNAFVAQIPPVTGIWTGLLDGMDGRVL